MLIFGKDILNHKIITADNEESKTKVDDLLLNKKTYNLDYLLFIEKNPENYDGQNRIDTSMDNVINSAGGQTAANTPPITGEDSILKSYDKETRYVSFNNVIEVTEHYVKVGGVDQQLHDPVDSIATSAIIGKKVKTNNDEALGKVIDIVIDWETRRVVGLALADGFWAKLVSEENRFLRLKETMDWGPEEIIVPNHFKDYLVDSVNEIIG
ncbi:PRC-barrel domain-containing protein [Pseudalkalibacillus salsuginis]|uniref:PRC-barrel domain-containing protein n=1 Tax=Pseudalkalibacillus salsuginis TaxID=2910972 RepID=UPI001F2CFD7B|nr:PRC-barrel domain-containing protein [Pseudalkalibacillus salsuginis]MCF6408848.1 PRC-barrel domain-containing protein [Pseudalkalibacillus salsuginis]